MAPVPQEGEAEKMLALSEVASLVITSTSIKTSATVQGAKTMGSQFIFR